MWEVGPVPSGDALRQGDLLLAVPFPSLPVPLASTRSTVAREEEARAVLNIRERTVLVVSHCCATSDSYLAVAPVLPKKIKGEAEERALLAGEPPRADDPGEDFGFDLAHFRLEPVEPALGVLAPSVHHAAHLTRIISFTGGCDSLTSSRVARLDPLGRRLLRIKLSLFWGRPEQEDQEYLEAHGMPLGLAQ